MTTLQTFGEATWLEKTDFKPALYMVPNALIAKQNWKKNECRGIIPDSHQIVVMPVRSFGELVGFAYTLALDLYRRNRKLFETFREITRCGPKIMFDKLFCRVKNMMTDVNVYAPNDILQEVLTEYKMHNSTSGWSPRGPEMEMLRLCVWYLYDLAPAGSPKYYILGNLRDNFEKFDIKKIREVIDELA